MNVSIALPLSSALTLTFATFVPIVSAQDGQDYKAEYKAVDASKFMSEGATTLTPEQRKALYLHQSSAFIRAADLDFDGKVEQSEIDKLVQQANSAASFYVDKDKERIGTASVEPTRLEEERLVIKKPSEISDSPLAGIQIRRTLEDVTPPSEQSKFAEKFKAAKAAEFGFASNNITDNETWSARGVIARPFRIGPTSDGSGGYLTPSIQFDRVSNSSTSVKDIDNLIFGVTGTWIPRAVDPLAYQEIRLGARYGSNFDLDAGLYGGELQYEPTFRVFSNGVYDEIPHSNGLYVRTRQWLHFEGGGDDRSAAVRGDSYLRGGAGVGLEVIPWAERLTLSADYRCYFDLLSNDTDDYHNLKLAATWRLDEVGHYVLQASYEDGLIPLSMQDVDLFSLAFGIKF